MSENTFRGTDHKKDCMPIDWSNCRAEHMIMEGNLKQIAKINDTNDHEQTHEKQIDNEQLRNIRICVGQKSHKGKPRKKSK